MLAQDTAFGFNVPGSNTPIEISAEGLRDVLGQIEAELYRSEVYRRAVKTLQQMPAKGAASGQFLMKAIGREAVRLTLRHLMRPVGGGTQEASGMWGEDVEKEADEFPVAAFARALGSQTVPATSQFPLEIVAPVLEIAESHPEPEPTPVTAIETAVETATGSASKKSRRKISPAEIAEQAAQERQDGLRQIGEQIRHAREARSMSFAELHRQTLVPIHQLQALEAGHGTHLPEDIYLRGFIKRIGTALKLDNESLLASLPKPDPVQAVLPTWYHPREKATGVRGLAVQPVHLYVGYAALMAGGLVWLSHQSAPETPPGAVELDSPRVTTSPQMQSDQELKPSTNVAPPERF